MSIELDQSNPISIEEEDSFRDDYYHGFDCCCDDCGTNYYYEEENTMKLTLRDINGACEGLMKIKDCNLPVKLAYSVLTLFNQLVPEHKKFEELRTAKIKEYGEEVNGVVTVKPDLITQFVNEIETLLAQEVEFTDLSLLDKDKLLEQQISVSAGDLAKLEPVFVK